MKMSCPVCVVVKSFSLRSCHFIAYFNFFFWLNDGDGDDAKMQKTKRIICNIYIFFV